MKKLLFIVGVLFIGCEEPLIKKCPNNSKCVYEWRSLVNPDWTGEIILECGHKRGEEGKMGNAGYVFTTDGTNILDYKSK